MQIDPERQSRLFSLGFTSQYMRGGFCRTRIGWPGQPPLRRGYFISYQEVARLNQAAWDHLIELIEDNHPIRSENQELEDLNGN
jgi:hypothetical protein